MPKNKVLSRPDVQISSHRNAVDLSQNASSTSLLGELEVCYVQPFVKGSTGSINRSCVTRTASVVSPAFHRITEHYDFFMVPIHCLWRPWENYKLNMNDMQDTNLVPLGSNNQPNLNLVSQVPRMNFYNLIGKLGFFSGTSTSVGANNIRKANDVLRFADELGYGERVVRSQTETSGRTVMNLFKIAAYQKIYYQFYRNKVYESNNPYAYNLDWLTYNNTDGELDLSTDKGKYVAEQLFTRRRCNLRNDYFHNVYPGLNYVSSELSGLTGFFVPSNIGQLIYPYSSSTIPSSHSATGAVGAKVSMPNTSTYGTVSVQNIRAAFALDKLMRAAAYAPKSVREQYKAQFGVDGHEYDSDMEATRLGSFQSSVAFQEVVNMAQSENYDLGSLGAKGLGGSERENAVKFHCEYDCIVMGIHYFSVRAKYDYNALEPWNTHLSRSEFYVKAFENLGLRPFDSVYISATDSSRIIAWTLPNFEYKIKPDVNHGLFKASLLQYETNDGTDAAVNINDSYLSSFVPHTDVSSGSVVTAEYFKVSPSMLDNVFAEKIPADHRREIFQFFTDYTISVPAVIPMSIHGQPVL